MMIMLKGFKAVLSESHGNSLSPHISKMLSDVTHHLRDQDSAVQSAYVNVVVVLLSRVTKLLFSSFLKPLADVLFSKQDVNSQIRAALCLASAVDATPDPEPAKLGKFLPKFEKLLKCDSFKVKPVLLTLIGSVIEVGGVSGKGSLRNLATAEALGKLAVLERDLLPEFKAGCLKTFENQRFDKMLEAWKQIPDVSSEVSPLPQSHASSKENASDGRYAPGSRNYSAAAGSEASQLRRKPIPANRLTPPESSYATTARKKSPFKSNEMNFFPAMSQKQDRKKPSNWKVEGMRMSRIEGSMIKKKKEISKRRLFYKSIDEKVNKFGTFRFRSRVAPYQEESTKSTEDIHPNHRECEDLSLIRNQLEGEAHGVYKQKMGSTDRNDLVSSTITYRSLSSGNRVVHCATTRQNESLSSPPERPPLA
ncbi:hypothetical protein UlMin_042269 [Ulmus minor]